MRFAAPDITRTINPRSLTERSLAKCDGKKTSAHCTVSCCIIRNMERRFLWLYSLFHSSSFLHHELLFPLSLILTGYNPTDRYRLWSFTNLNESIINLIKARRERITTTHTRIHSDYSWRRENIPPRAHTMITFALSTCALHVYLSRAVTCSVTVRSFY